jgi:hypothetical protein
MAGNIVHLIGYPGVGKLTIAKEIVRQRPDFVLVDNHLINNPVFSVSRADGKTPLPAEIWVKASQIRAIVLDTMERLAPSDLSFVMMSNFAVENEEDKAECRKIEAVAARRGGQYFPVILTCDVEENRRRIVSPERGPNLKSIDPDEPDRLQKGAPLLRFEGHPNRIQIDVSHTKPAEAAKQILQKVGHARTNTPSATASDFCP